MKIILFFTCMLFSTGLFSQENVRLIDSLKKIINKGLPYGDDKKTINKQIAYIKACEALGDFYKKINNQKTALYYYRFVTNLTEYTDSDLWENEIPIKLRDMVRLKAGDLFLTGKGIKKNLDSALYFHTWGLLHRHNKASYYSQYYFKSQRPFFVDATESKTDSLTSYPINPFYLVNKFSSSLNKDDFKKEIELLNSDTTLNCLLQNNIGMIPKSMIGQYALHKYLEEIKKHFSRHVINPDRISLQTEFNSKPYIYKSLSLPFLEIMISEKSFY